MVFTAEQLKAIGRHAYPEYRGRSYVDRGAMSAGFRDGALKLTAGAAPEQRCTARSNRGRS